MQFDCLVKSILRESLTPNLEEGVKEIFSIMINYNYPTKNSSCSEVYPVRVPHGMFCSQWDEPYFLEYKGSDFFKALDVFIDRIYQLVSATNKQTTINKAIQEAQQMEHLHGTWVVGYSISDSQIWMGVEIDPEQYRTGGIIDTVKSITSDTDISDW